jgi:16S rRNA (adenine1518-N6/adenine1519-N6)-dimethyltransferase
VNAGAAPGIPSSPSWSDLRARLEAAGFHPSRGLGQNFLRDPNLARAIVRDSGVAAGDFVLEVGPGCCMLSLRLLEAGVRLCTVEIDPRLAAIARELLAGAGAETPATVLETDVLAGKHALAPEVLAHLPAREPWHVVANLPYSAGTPFLVLVSRLANPPRSATVLLQRELALRFAAEPGGKIWGPVGARLRLIYDVTLLRRVGPELFWPRPEVESALVRLDLRSERPPPAEVAAFDRLVGGLFQARRKSLAGRLGDLWGDREGALTTLQELGIDPRARVETLGVGDLSSLARAAPPVQGDPEA